MAAKNALYCEHGSSKYPETIDGFVGVLRAGWVKFAARLVREATQRAVIEGEGLLVETYAGKNDAFQHSSTTYPYK